MSDLIKRQDVLDAIMGQTPEPRYPIYYRYLIKQIPSVAPKPGHWEIKEAPASGYCNYMICSECHEQFIEDKEYNFCPNCGADMRGETE